ncbi:hydroxysqualene dehydroxylase HpnE [Candidatus Bipolaricaulota bacterium]|nr:hydroxysqualene dehydroxylase HpnE [Candidatus Bipolaricaulota bacterium]
MERAVVIGGGFAGVAAACRLAGDGHRPILLERAPRLGGRAGSYVDRETGETIDYGHHVLMHCCTASRGFLARIGASDAVRFQLGLRIPILCDGRTTLLRSSLLPGPAHLAPSLLAYRPIPMRDRLRVLRAGAALLLPCQGDEASFRKWLGRHGQSEVSIERLWDPISIATLNAPADRVSVPAARQVFRDGFFVPGGANIGLFARPLSEIFDQARAYLERHEAVSRTRADVAHILLSENTVRGVRLADGELIECDAVVAAVPPDALRGMLEDGGDLTKNVDRAALLEPSPIVDVHVWFDRPVMEEPFVIAVDAPIQTVFDLGRLHDSGRPSGHVVVSQSAAVDWMRLSSEEIGERVVEALRELLPSARGADCLRRRVIKHPRATFVPSPGSDALRPKAKTPVEGLFLAGDWTATGWPSTIDGAIRSGVAAAAHVEVSWENEAPET